MPFTGRDAVKRDLMAESGREETDLVGKSTGFLDSSERDAVHGAEQRMGTPVFEMVVLGSGGGPLETDCSG